MAFGFGSGSSNSHGDLPLITAAQGTNATGTDAVICTKTFTANELSANDTIMVVAQYESNGGFCRNKIKITDGASAVTISGHASGDPVDGTCVFFISQSQRANTRYIAGWQNADGSNTGNCQAGALTNANWITTAWTLDYLGSDGGGGTSYYKVWFYRIRGSV